jgi:protein gp37
VATQSKIEWTEMTWNPVTGCSKVRDGCKNCYAERMAKRLQAMGIVRYQNAFRLTLHDDLIELPLKWKQPKVVFVNSMSDLFHEDIPVEFIQKVFDSMVRCPQHIFQVLTKRSRRLKNIAAELPWPDNVWMGVSVENSQTGYRIQDLCTVPAAIRFLSCEPLIGPIQRLPLVGIHWVIVGGESGPGARIMHPEWVEDILSQCEAANVAFFFKQWGGTRKKRTGRILHNQTYDEMPRLFQPQSVYG